ncbi:hypothetical protein ATCC90586_010523 [Pythium insidiosum]|nr:hypothetical protein ATCC90586_010523 [Pythium insidiosum]
MRISQLLVVVAALATAHVAAQEPTIPPPPPANTQSNAPAATNSPGSAPAPPNGPPGQPVPGQPGQPATGQPPQPSVAGSVIEVFECAAAQLSIGATAEAKCVGEESKKFNYVQPSVPESPSLTVKYGRSPTPPSPALQIFKADYNDKLTDIQFLGLPTINATLSFPQDVFESVVNLNQLVFHDVKFKSSNVIFRGLSKLTSLKMTNTNAHDVSLAQNASNLQFVDFFNTKFTTLPSLFYERAYSQKLKLAGAISIAPSASALKLSQAQLQNIRNNVDDLDLLGIKIPEDCSAQPGWFVVCPSEKGSSGSGLGSAGGEQVAIKRLAPHRRKDLKQLLSFVEEAKLVASMQHPRIIRFIGIAWDSPLDIHVVTEYMEQGDVRSFLRHYHETRHPTGFSNDKLKIALHIAQGLAYMHAHQPQVLHRDLKSSNVLLTTDLDAKLIDFGVSRERADHTMTVGVGTLRWMAPEVMSGGRYGDRADVFSFGVILSELDTHELPYTVDGQPLRDEVIIARVSMGTLETTMRWKLSSMLALVPAMTLVMAMAEARTQAVNMTGEPSSACSLVLPGGKRENLCPGVISVYVNYEGGDPIFGIKTNGSVIVRGGRGDDDNAFVIQGADGFRPILSFKDDPFKSYSPLYALALADNPSMGLPRLLYQRKYDEVIINDLSFNFQEPKRLLLTENEYNNAVHNLNNTSLESIQLTKNCSTPTLVIGKEISQGAYGRVYEGTWQEEKIAIKRLAPHRREDLDHFLSFIDEAKLMASMQHPRIIRFIGIAWDSPLDIHVVTEYMEQGDLRRLLVRYRKQNRPTGFSNDKLKIALHIAQGLAYMHAHQPQVLHRDLKSSNVLLTTDLDAKLIDFGVSRERADHTMTVGVGTLRWMAPEVMSGGRYGDRADVFSFGVILSELDTHELPYTVDGQPLRDEVIIARVSMGTLEAIGHRRLQS